MTEDYFIRDAGKDLVDYSQNYGEEDSRSLTELLFPSIFIASKRMSARAISRWLEENKSIKFSAASVAKAIRNQERYFESIADRVQPLAEHISHSLGLDPRDLLEGKTPPPSFLLDEEGTNALDADHYFELSTYIREAASKLEEEWFSLDREIRFRSLSYFDFPSSSEDRNED